ncbi:MAG: hypothetical protein OEZ08_08490, partial [Betaproteobacteria bacterium]|nr:hypothetical protein [Betaproteobacteria bacterium]
MRKVITKFIETLPRALIAGAVLACGSAAQVWAMPITKQLVVNVVTVCNDAGLNCASQGPAGNTFYEAETDKIWAQAGIDISFVNAGTLNSSAFLTGASSVTDFTGPLGGTGTTMYLTSDLLCSACTLYGEAYLNAGGLVINMGAVNAFNAGVGRLDTIAHELGHNLGIGHPADAQYLMAAGSLRNIPSNLGEICPDPDAASCFDWLPA